MSALTPPSSSRHVKSNASSRFDRELEERLLRYARIDTQSDETSSTCPSTSSQLVLLSMLERELRELGAHDVRLTDYGVTLATIRGTAGSTAPTIAFLAHVDTTPDVTAANVRPIAHRNYAGGDLVLPDDPTIVLSPGRFPYLASKVGHDIVTASGTTLLGADDKAGVAIVMTMARHLLRHPELPHGPIRIAFTPDEEIGTCAYRSLREDLRAQVAYTLDGGDLGEIAFETFSADRVLVRVKGVPTAPGEAKGRLVNALHLGATIIGTLPKLTLTPETTSGREGFIHLHQMSGTASSVDLHFIVRDFELEGLRAKGEVIEKICAAVQAAEPRAQITCTTTQEYRNMRYWLERDMRPVDLARQACRQLGIEPLVASVRGGTDGARLSELGLPTPNLFTGAQNIHGFHEWISVQDMARATDLCLALVELWGQAAASPPRAPRARTAAPGGGAVVRLLD